MTVLPGSALDLLTGGCAPDGPAAVTLADPNDHSKNYTPGGVVPYWMKERMRDLGYDPADAADRQLFIAAYLVHAQPEDDTPARGPAAEGIMVKGARARRGIRLAATPPEAPTPARAIYAPGTVYDIPVGDLMPDPCQPRKLFDPDALRTLSESMGAAGQQHPIRFRLRPAPPAGEPPLILVDGERRWRAAQLAGLATLRALLDTEADSGAALIARQALLNEPGRPLSPWDWMLTFQYLAQAMDLTPGEIAHQLAQRGVTTPTGRPWSRSQVANYQRLLDLPAWVQTFISDGTLTPSHGLYILSAKDREPILADLQQWLTRALAPSGDAPPADAPPADPDTQEPPPRTVSVALLRSELRRLHAQHYAELGQSSFKFGRWIDADRLTDWDRPDGKCRGCRMRADHDGHSYCTATGTEFACLRDQVAATRPPPPDPSIYMRAPYSTLTGEPQDPDAPAPRAPDPAADTPPPQRRQPIDWEARERLAARRDEQIKAALATAEPIELQSILLWFLLRREYLITAREASRAPKPADVQSHLSGRAPDRFLRRQIAVIFERALGDAERAIVAEYLRFTLLDDAAPEQS
jgi:ParB/RepB/Spo0J family partition protein